MSDPLSLEDQVNAKLDAISLSEVVNGAPGTVITTRLGRTLRPLAEIGTVDGAVPLNGDCDINGVKTFNSPPIVPTPVGANDATPKGYTDQAVAAGRVAPLGAVACATTANITLSGEQTIDGVLTSASRVGVKNQSSGAENGVWVSGAGAWSRATDANTAGKIGLAEFFVSGGSANIGSTYQCQQLSASITLGTTPLMFALVANASASAAAEEARATAREDELQAQIIPLSGAIDPANFVELSRDKNGNAIWGVDRDIGPVPAYTNHALTPRVYSHDATSDLTALYDPKAIHMFILWGQSLATGASQLGDSPLTTTAADPGWALMFDPGPWPNGRAIVGLTDLLESDYNTTTHETACSGFAVALNARLDAALDFKIKILMAIAGVSGSDYSALRKGTAAYAELERIIRAGRDEAHKLGCRLVVHGLIAMHGESDTDDGVTTRWQYRDFMDQLMLDFEQSVAEICPQMQPPRLWAYATDPRISTAGVVPEVTMAMVDLHNRRQTFRTACAVYPFDRGANDGFHLSNTGYYKLGETFADDILGSLFGLPNQGPLRIVEAWQSAATTFDFRFSLPVTIDASGAVITTSGLGNGKGFEFHDLSGAIPAISSVAAVGGTDDTLRVTLASAPAGPRKRFFLACHKTGANVGPTTGARSQFRSTTAFATSGRGGSLYHWALPAIVEFA